MELGDWQTTHLGLALVPGKGTGVGKVVELMQEPRKLWRQVVCIVSDRGREIPCHAIMSACVCLLGTHTIWLVINSCNVLRVVGTDSHTHLAG